MLVEAITVMTKRRMIHEDFFQSEVVAMWSIRQRLLVIGMISVADDQGRLKGHPRWIQSQIFPYDAISIDDISSDLSDIASVNDTIRLYQVEGRSYIQLIHWWDYQGLQWAKPSKHPAPSDWQDRIRQMIYQTSRNSKRWIMTVSWPDTPDRTTYEKTHSLANALANEPPAPLANEPPAPLAISNTNTNTIPIPVPSLISSSLNDQSKLPPLPSIIASPAMMTAWGEWCQYQQDKGHPLTFRTAKAQQDMFTKWGEERSLAAMDFSMAQGYKGLIEPKGTGNSKRPKTLDGSMAAIKAALGD